MFADSELANLFARGAKEIVRMSAETYKQLNPDVGETFLDLGGTYAAFTGNGSPLTQASGDFSAGDLNTVAGFFHGRTDEWEAVVSPFCDAGALDRLMALGGKARSWENLLFRPNEPVFMDLPIGAQVVELETSEQMDVWSRIGFDGLFADAPSELAKLMGGSIGRLGPARSKAYLALWNGEPAASARSTVVDRVLWLSGAATLLPYRRRGLQQALIAARIGAAADVDVAFIGTSPGTSSQRNAERFGFRVAHSQLSVFVPS